MKRSDMKKILKENPVLAILRNVPQEQLFPYVDTVLDGGIRFFEVALNSGDAAEQIRRLKRQFGKDILVGAGTATTVERAEKAVEAGAEFLLSPSADIPVLSYCREHGIALLPGAFTPSEVNTCIAWGCTEIKLFPAGELPPSYVRSLKGPLEQAEYIAIGGVNWGNVLDYLRAGCLGVGMGSALLPGGELKGAAAAIRREMERIWRFKKGETGE